MFHTNPQENNAYFTGLENNFSNGFITPEFGTLPTEPPATTLPGLYTYFDAIAEDIQNWIKNNDVSTIIKMEEQLSNPALIEKLSILTNKELSRLNVILGTCAHAYSYLLNKNPDDAHRVDTELPKLFALWKSVSQHMGRGDNPILSISDAAYYNWQYKDKTTLHHIDNLKYVENIQRLVPVFNNKEDDISNLGMIVFEAHFADVVRALNVISNAISKNDHALLESELDKIFTAMQIITRSLLDLFNLHQGSDNYINLEVWTDTYIKFVKRSYPDEPSLAGFADHFFYIIEAMLGRRNYDSRLGQEMLHTEAALPTNIKLFIQSLKQTNIRNYIEQSNNPSLKRKFQIINEAYLGDHGFLGVHKNLALSISILGSQNRSATNGGNKLGAGIGEQLESSRMERKNSQLENVHHFQIQHCDNQNNGDKNSYHITLELCNADTTGNGLSFLESGACLSIPIKNSEIHIQETLALLKSRGIVIDLDEKIDISHNSLWLAELKKWPAYTEINLISIKQLLFHADLNHITQSVNDINDFAQALLPAAERIYSVSGIKGNTVNLLIKRQIYNDGHIGAGSYFLTNEQNIGQTISCRILPPIKFTLPKVNDKPVLLVASGNGISPFLHFLNQLNECSYNHPIYLVYFTRADEAEWLKDILSSLHKLKDLHVCLVHSGENKKIEWVPYTDKFNIDLNHDDKCIVINEIIREIKSHSDFNSYICGGISFTKSILNIHKNELGSHEFNRMIGNGHLVSEAFSFTELSDNQSKLDSEFTLEEVKQHDSEKSCWVVMNNEVFDVTSYLDIHPGGKDIFLSKALFERDISDVYRVIHQNNPTANSWLSSFRIGHLKQTMATMASSPSNQQMAVQKLSCPFLSNNYVTTDMTVSIKHCPFASNLTNNISATTESHKPAGNSFELFYHSATQQRDLKSIQVVSRKPNSITSLLMQDLFAKPPIEKKKPLKLPHNQHKEFHSKPNVRCRGEIKQPGCRK